MREMTKKYDVPDISVETFENMPTGDPAKDFNEYKWTKTLSEVREVDEDFLNRLSETI